jgi:hypothetical protein
MSEKINLKNLEKNAFISYHEDGIIDIFAGIWILIFGLLSIFTERVWVAGMFLVYGVPIWGILKNKITVPRMGYVKFKNGQISQIKKTVFIILLVVYACAFVLYILEDYYTIPSWICMLIQGYPILVFGFAVTLSFIMGAWIVQIHRFYAYAVLSAFLSVGCHAVNSPFGYVPILLGILIMGGGMVRIKQFIHTYPVESEQVGG